MSLKTPTIPKKNSILEKQIIDVMPRLARAIRRKYNVKVNILTNKKAFSHIDPYSKGLIVCALNNEFDRELNSRNYNISIFFSAREMTATMQIDPFSDNTRTLRNRLLKFIDYQLFGTKKEPSKKKQKQVFQFQSLLRTYKKSS